MKKIRRLFVFLLMPTIILSSFVPVYAFQRIFNAIHLSEDVVYLTEAKEVEVFVDLGYEPNLENLEWSLSGRPFEEWRKYDDERLAYNGDPMVYFIKEPYFDEGKVKATLKFDVAHQEPEDDYARNINLNVYQPMIGSHYLAVTDTFKEAVYNCKITFKPYEDFHTYTEIKQKVDKIINNTRLNRYIEYQSLGASETGRNIHFTILAKDKASVNKYLEETLPMMLSNPEKLQKDIESGKVRDYKLPIWFGNIHPQEIPCTDAILNVLEVLATEDTFEYNIYGRDHIDRTENSHGKHLVTDEFIEKVTINIDEILEDAIILCDFTTNPDGRDLYQRQNANQFDLNRDCSIQSQAESRAVINAIAKWRPTIFLEYHGYYPEYVIEPCTPPHDPNVEIDLLLPNNLKLAYAMGDAAVGNTYFNEYQIPHIDRESGWEDLSPNFTDFFVQSLGCIGNMIELPWPDKESRLTLEYSSFAAIKFLSDNKEDLFLNQLEYYRRGIGGIDVKEAVDSFLIGPDGTAVGRPRGDNENFFPEYYIIPVDKSIQRNALEAYRVVQRMLNSGIEINQTTKNVELNSVLYPKGSFVVDMHQATRALANNYLYNGLDTSDYPSVYSENLINMPNTFGFDKYEIRISEVLNSKQKSVFDKNNMKSINEVAVPTTKLPSVKSSFYLIKNTNNDTIRAVNGLLNTKINVQMIEESRNGYNAGDFIVSNAGIELIKDKFLLEVEPYKGSVKTFSLVKPKVNVIPIIPRENPDGGLEFALKQMGFDIVDNQKNSNIILSTANYDVKESILNGKSYIGLGKDAMKFLKKSNLLLGFDYKLPVRSGDEALVYSELSANNIITACYNNNPNKAMYIGRGGIITGVPQNAEVLAKASNRDDFMIAGNWPNNESDIKGQVLAITTEVGDANITVFGSNFTYKALAQDDWRMLANAIYTSVK